MRVLVTGGAGYVGSTLVSLLLESGHRVRVLDNLLHGGRALLGVWSHPDFEFVHGDVRDDETVERALEDVDAVVHLAAIVGDPAGARDPEVTKAVNYEASLNLLERAQNAAVDRFVFAATCSNYGKMEDEAFMDEESPLRPVSLYAETKVDVERAVLDADQTEGLCATSLRFATVFGTSPRMRFDLTVNHFTMQLMVDKELVVFGQQFWRPYVHVRDAARGVLGALEAPASKVDNEVFNVGSTDQNYQKKTIVERIEPYAPDAEIEYVEKDQDPRNYRVSFDKINEVLDYETTIDLDEGIAEVADLVRHEVIEDFDNEYYRN